MSVYAWGANSHGQLGLGYESELCMTPQLVNKCSFSASSVRCIRGGGGHVLVLDTNGRLHACGWNNRGQLGLDSMEDCHNEFERVPMEFFDDVQIESIACGWDLSGCITSNRKLYVWGSNSFKQLGFCQRGFNAVRRPLPVTLPRDDIPRHISFGLRHCAILTENHIVYVFGRLRINDPAPHELTITATTLNRAEVLKIYAAAGSDLQIKNISSGQNHLLLKICSSDRNNDCRRIIALGDNKFGQSNAFQFDEEIRQMATGWTHNAVILKDNRVMLWGRNCYGQLGNGTATDCQPIPIPLELPTSVVPARVHMGSEHALVRSTEGVVLTWGWNEHGNCGNDSTDNVYSPTVISRLPAVCRKAGTGAGFCYAICEAAIVDP